MQLGIFDFKLMNDVYRTAMEDLNYTSLLVMYSTKGSNGYKAEEMYMWMEHIWKCRSLVYLDVEFSMYH